MKQTLLKSVQIAPLRSSNFGTFCGPLNFGRIGGPSGLGHIQGAKLAHKDFGRRNFGSYIEGFYTTGHATTGFATPLRRVLFYTAIIFQTVITFGVVLHTNYYYTGKVLPKTDGQTQLCSDSR